MSRQSHHLTFFGAISSARIQYLAINLHCNAIHAPSETSSLPLILSETRNVEGMDYIEFSLYGEVPQDCPAFPQN